MPETNAAGEMSASELRLQRNLKIVVVVLAVLLAAGLAAIVARIFYVASRPAAQPAVVSGEALKAGLSMQLPAGADVRSISLSGDRLAVHYSAGGREGVAVLDLKSGAPLASVELKK
jgi:uncharacterized membrane protein